MNQREPSFDLDAMSWTDAGTTLARDPRIILPVGALEQHGPHLPLGTNCLIAGRIAHDLASEFHIPCAPTFFYGVNAAPKQAYAGATSLRPKTLHLALNELLNGWERYGVAEFIIITAHRFEPHIQAIATLYPGSARVRVVQLWDIPIQDLLERQDRALHAGEAETSVMLYLYPRLVWMDRARDFSMPDDLFQRYLQGRLQVPVLEGAGTIGFPTAATAEKGKLIYQRMLNAIRNAIFLEPVDSESDSL